MFKSRKRSSKGYLESGLCGFTGIGCCVLSMTTLAAEPAGTDVNRYLDKIQINRTENFLQREIREYSSYPHLDKAQRLAKSGKTEEAIAEFERYLSIDPLDAKARMAYSMFLYKSRHYMQAVEQLDVILKSHPELIPAWLYRGLAKQTLEDYRGASKDFETVMESPDAQPNDRRFALNSMTDISIGHEQYPQALALLKQLSTIDRSFETYFRQGVVLEKLSRLPDAISAYETALKLPNTESERLRGMRAIAEASAKLRNWEDVKRSNEQILQLAQDDAHAMRSMAYASYNLKDRDGAIKWIKNVLAKEDNSQDREFLANLLTESRQYQAACTEYLKLSDTFKKTDDRQRVLMALGYCYQHLDRQQDAATAFRQASVIGEGRQSLEALAMAQEASGQSDAAIETYRRLLNISPDTQERLKFANLLNAKKRYQEACVEYKSVLPNMKEGKDRYEVLMALGYCYQHLNRENEAADAFRQAAAMSDEPRSLEALTATQEATGNTAAAIETYRRLLKVSPTAQNHLKLANLYRASHDNAQALVHYENALKLGLPGQQQASAWAQMGMTHYDMGNYAKARDSLERADAITPNDPTLLYALGETASKNGESEAALRYLQKAAAIKPTTQGLKALADLNVKLGFWQAAEKIYQQLLAGNKLSLSDQAKVLEGLSYVYTQLGQDDVAAHYLDKAIVAGRDFQDTHKNLGFILFKQQRWNEALEQFAKALEHKPEPTTLIAMGQVYHKLNRPKEAIARFEEARLSESQLQPNERKALLDELGYLYAGESAYDKAIKVWQQSLTISPDPQIAISYASGLRKLKRNADARTALQNIAEDKLPNNAVKAQRWDELAQLYAEEKALDKAIDAQKHALGLIKTPARHYQLALLYQKSNQPDAAIPEFRLAAEQEPSNPLFVESLAYAYANADRPEEASRMFEQMLAQDPKRIGLMKELGYINMHKPDNPKASEWFKKAIDMAQANPDLTKTAAERNVENYRLREEVEKLNHYVDISAYQQLRVPDSNQGNRRNNTTQGGVLGGVIPSQGGVELALKPPVIGLRDERTFQVFTRFLWNAPPGSLHVDSDSIQGGIGFRYKPLKTQNLFVGAEHLFKIGQNATDNWLLRASYGWSYGDGLKFGQSSWDYTTIYTDLGYFTNDTGVLAFYGEARQGYTFNIKDTLLVTPHLVLDGRTQTHDVSNISYFEAGAGFSFRYFFNESHYTSKRTSVEFLTQYKTGISNIDGGFVATGIFRY